MRASSVITSIFVPSIFKVAKRGVTFIALASLSNSVELDTSGYPDGEYVMFCRAVVEGLQLGFVASWWHGALLRS
nr:MAG TPA: hypothetical protein [Caudoviricetes sp.]